MMTKIRAKKKVYIETNVEKLAIYYFKLANVNSLEELKKSDYWQYFERDKLSALRATKKKEFETNEKPLIKKDLFFKCSSCKKDLGYQVFNSFVLDNLEFDYKNKVLQIKCSCGAENSYHIPGTKKKSEAKNE